MKLFEENFNTYFFFFLFSFHVRSFSYVISFVFLLNHVFFNDARCRRKGKSGEFTTFFPPVESFPDDVGLSPLRISMTQLSIPYDQRARKGNRTIEFD